MNNQRTIYFDCFAGISGDMLLGALVDLGVDLKIIRNEFTRDKGSDEENFGINPKGPSQGSGIKTSGRL